MSLQTMPILFLNMGGEMVYILEQRLQAQTVKQEKSIRVMTDIVGTMFSKKFIEEIFKPQILYSRKGMRALFEKLAHASIMRLNTTSMDKLYDLMTMACKWQLQMCVSPGDILLVTLNHLDGIRKVVQGISAVQSQIDYAYSLLEEHFFKLSHFELNLVRTTLLAFYQDARVKVSLLLREKKQRDDGRFIIAVKGGKVPYKGGIPGVIKHYSKGEQTTTATFNSGGSYAETVLEGSLSKTAKQGERAIAYGSNMYKTAGNAAPAAETQGGYGSAAMQHDAGADATSSTSPVSKADDELSLLCKLLAPKAYQAAGSVKKRAGSASRGKSPSKAAEALVLSFFDTPESEEAFVREAEKAVAEEVNTIRIDASKRDNRDVSKMVADLDVKDGNKKKPKGEDLLDLMDSTDP